MNKKKIIIILIGCFLFVFTTIIYNPFNIIRLELFFNNVEKVEIYSYQGRDSWIETASPSYLEELKYIFNYKIDINEKYVEANKRSFTKSTFIRNYHVEKLDFKCLFKALNANYRSWTKHPCLKRCIDPFHTYREPRSPVRRSIISMRCSA
jgi:hypothetical protein